MGGPGLGLASVACDSEGGQSESNDSFDSVGLRDDWPLNWRYWCITVVRVRLGSPQESALGVPLAVWLLCKKSSRVEKTHINSEVNTLSLTKYRRWWART